VSDFGDEFGAVEAERADADPPPPEPDVAGLDVALADPGLRSGKNRGGRAWGIGFEWAGFVRVGCDHVARY